MTKDRPREPARRTKNGPTVAAKQKGITFRMRIWGLNIVFVLLILAGSAYLIFDKRGDSEPDRESRTNLPPAPIATQGADRARAAAFDAESLRAWCQGQGLPIVPGFPALEGSIAEALYEALQDVSRLRTPGAFGKVGQICETQLAHDCAKEYFRRAAALNASDFRWPYYLGCVHQITGQNQEAIASLLTAQQLNPAYPTTYARLAQLYFETGRFDEAAPLLLRFVELSPSDWLGHVGLGRVALHRKDAAQALVHLQRAAELGPNDFQVHYYLGRAYAELGRLEEAQRHFKLSEKLPRGAWFSARDPLDQEMKRAAQSADQLTLEFKRIQDSGDWAQLAALAEEIIRRRPEDVSMMANLASFYRKMKRFDDALAVLDRARSISPDSAKLQTTRAEVHLAQSHPGDALDAANKALDWDPEQGLAHSIRGRALILLERFPEGEAAMRRAVTLRPGDSADLFVLGEALRLQGKNAEAVACYRKVLEQQPDFSPARQRLAELQKPPNDKGVPNP